ncbi:MAG: bifunctional 5,10-methylenetetrahydrofolate dehydrogenase/5,10-methenyltetrahydrofolate cyclohydrolase [Chlamydiota bacterium]
MILDGKKAAEALYKQIESSINPQKPPSIAMILVGENAPSITYVTMKQKAAARLGIQSQVIRLAKDISEEALCQEIKALNAGPIDGILVQMPLPSHINAAHVMATIAPSKDVDGLHPYNAGLLALGQEGGFIPCTPFGIKYLLDFYKISTAGRHVVILGRSILVGRPLATLLSQKAFGGQATVTLAHSQSAHLEEICLSADILIAAVGSPLFIKESMVKEGAIVIDVGITEINGRLIGDVDFENVQKKCYAISPVPGGVGPMTIACLLRNTVKASLQSS